MASKWIAGALCAVGLCVATHASASSPSWSSAEFKLDTPTGLDEGQGGHWVTNNTFQASLVTGHDGSSPSDTRTLNIKSRKLDPSASEGVPFGLTRADLPAQGGDPLSAQAVISHGLISTSRQSDHGSDEASATLNWERAFALDPFASVTFTGIALLSNTLDMLPRTHFSIDSSRPDSFVNQATLSLRDEATFQSGINLFAHIFNDNPAAPGTDVQNRLPSFNDFTYSTDPLGRLSLTVHNRSDRVMYGDFELFAYAWNAAPVPEPAVWLCMALGLLAIAGRRPRRPSLAA